MATEDKIMDALDDLRGLKQELKEQQKEENRIRDEIEGLEDDIESSQRNLDQAIKEYLEGGGEMTSLF